MSGKFFERPEGREHRAGHFEPAAHKELHKETHQDPHNELHNEVHKEMRKHMLDDNERRHVTHSPHVQRHVDTESTAKHYLPHLTIEDRSHKPKEFSSDKGDATPSKTGFSERLLQGIGAPVTAANLKLLDAWQRAEGGPKNNPLNTSQYEPGATTFNKDGVKRYGSLDVGIEATIATLKSSNYKGIVASLKAGNDAHTTALAIRDSIWGSKNITNFV